MIEALLLISLLTSFILLALRYYNKPEFSGYYCFKHTHSMGKFYLSQRGNNKDFFISNKPGSFVYFENYNEAVAFLWNNRFNIENSSGYRSAIKNDEFELVKVYFPQDLAK